MEHGPLPPHERTWRHPSELAAEEHALARAEPAGLTTRAFAFASGSVGLLAVGLLVLAVTPGRSAAPVAISATTTPIDRSDPVAFSTSSTAATSSISQDGGGPGPVALRGRPEVLATPIGEGRHAVVTAADLADTPEAAAIGASLEVAVPSGRTVDALVVAHGRHTVLVQLDRPEPGHVVALEQPEGHEIVTVLAEPPVTIVLDDLPQLDVEEGTAVLDDTGELVGLCTQDRDDETRLLPIDDLLEPDDPDDLDEPLDQRDDPDELVDHVDLDDDDDGPPPDAPPAGGQLSERGADATNDG